jgi:aminomethyltransferase
MCELKRTSIFSEYSRYGGKIVEFFGWELPVQFSGIIDEHLNIREKVGLFDVSHMGEILVTGKQAESFTDYMVTNSVKKMEHNKVIYTPACYENGGIVDDLLVYKFSNIKFLLVINASNVEKDFEWVKDNAKEFQVDVQNISSETTQLAIQGPKSSLIIKEFFNNALEEIKLFTFRQINYKGEEIIISRTGYTGEDGFEIYMPNKLGKDLWNDLLNTGQKYGIKPTGLGARDTLRFEAKLMLYGNDINENTNPIEASIGWTVKLDKENFIGKQALQNVKDDGLKRKLVGFEMIDRGIPRHNFKIFKDADEIGFVTSGTYAPYLKKNLGLGYVKIDQCNIGNIINVEINNKLLKAQIIKTPFYKRKK